MSISNFINQHYDVIFKSEQVESFDEVEEFLLGETHNSIDRQIHILFINIFGEESVVFFEGYKLFRIVDTIKNGINLQKVAAFGWDYILNGKRQRIEPDQLFESKEADEIEEELQKKQSRRLKFLESKNENKIKNLDKQIYQLTEKYHAVLDKINKNIKSYYDQRAAALNEALIKSHTLDTGFHNRKTFLIAGAAHLKKAAKGLEQKKLDQNAFYSFLNNRKTVILFPKGLQISDFFQHVSLTADSK